MLLLRRKINKITEHCALLQSFKVIDCNDLPFLTKGAVKVTQQPNSLSDEPTFLFENHDRLSVSGGNMDNNPAVGL